MAPSVNLAGVLGQVAGPISGFPARRPLSYSSVHRRLGPVGDRLCVDGCGRRATDWSLSRATPADRLVTDGRGRRFSTNPADYQARCTRCHIHYDGGPRRRPGAKLTPSQVQEIRRLVHTGGLPQRVIAARFGIERSTVSLIKRRRTWAA
jgi:hypothetical protein